MDLTTFFEESTAARSVEDASLLFKHALSDMGFDRMMYSALQAHRLSEQVCMISTYPDSWLEYYVSSDYMTLDPLRRYGQLQRAAFSWDMLSERYRFSRIEKKVMGEARDARLYDGAAVPLHGPGGELVGLAVASSEPNADTRRLLPQLNLITQQFHAVYNTLVETPAEPAPPSLSSREREVLQWAARGKSNWVIGELLHISEHGVDYHFRNILRKLEADSRITAVVKGLYYGVISL